MSSDEPDARPGLKSRLPLFGWAALVGILVGLAALGALVASDGRPMTARDGVSSAPDPPIKMTPPATQGQFYVAPNGSDSNPGTQAAPWLTIAHAASVVGGGTTVHVASGTYTQPVWVRASGSQLARIVFISDTQWAAHVSVLGSSAGWRNSGNYIDVEGFDITPRSRHLASPMKGPTTSWSATASTTWRHS